MAARAFGGLKLSCHRSCSVVELVTVPVPAHRSCIMSNPSAQEWNHWFQALPIQLGHCLASELRLDHQGARHGQPGQRGRHAVLRYDDPRTSVLKASWTNTPLPLHIIYATARPEPYMRQDAHRSGAAPKPALVFSQKSKTGKTGFRTPGEQNKFINLRGGYTW